MITKPFKILKFKILIKIPTALHILPPLELQTEFTPSSQDTNRNKAIVVIILVIIMSSKVPSPQTHIKSNKQSFL